MPANSILDQNNVQYVEGHQTLKDLVNTRIPLNATASVPSSDTSLDAGLHDGHEYPFWTGEWFLVCQVPL